MCVVLITNPVGTVKQLAAVPTQRIPPIDVVFTFIGNFLA